jgi:hypothetical protein
MKIFETAAKSEQKLRSGAGENKIQMGNGGTRKPDIGAETWAMRTITKLPQEKLNANHKEKPQILRNNERHDTNCKTKFYIEIQTRLQL